MPDKWAQYAVPTTPAASPTDKWAQYAVTDSIPAPQESNPIADFGKGILKGAVHTMSVADDWATQHLPAFMTTPIGQTPNHENSVRATQYAQDLSQTHNTSQAVGKGVEQAAEFLVPGSAEKAGIGMISKAAPKLATLGRYGVRALGSGVVNKAQGGSFTGGAAAGLFGEGFTQGLKAIAPTVAEIAMGSRAADRSLGKTPGIAILNETTGVNPGTIAQQAFDKSAGYTNALETNARSSNIRVNLQPARDLAESFGKTAAKQNNATNIKEIGQLGAQLDARGSTAIPQLVSADEGLGLRRGVDALMDSWNPNNKRTLSDSAIAAVRKAMNDELSKAVPDFDLLNKRISNLIPVAARAGATDLNAGVLQRVIGKAARPTGALVGTIAGGTAGYKEDGARGALIGGGLGLIAPEIATSPTTLMTLARGLNSGAAQVGAKALTGAALQADREDAPVLKGAAKWADLGAAKLSDHIGRDSGASLTADDVQALRKTSRGRDLLIQASDLNPGSPAMSALVKKASSLKQE